jgi:hypothetical protein
MKRHRLQLIAWAGLLIGWLGYFSMGGRVAHFLAGRFHGVLLRIGQGKFSDVDVFVQGRLREALWLATLALVWAAAHTVFDRSLRVRLGEKHWRWVAHGLAGFILLNLWVGAAANTALFWGVMGAGAGVENYMQFQFKRIVLEENPDPVRAVLVGSSQTRAQIDENELNRRLGTNLWTTELHFPGSKAYDLLLIEPQLRRANPQFVICYMSEGFFYVGSHGETPPNFLTLAELPDAWRRGALHYLSGEEIGYGLLGDALPVFRCREIISQRLLGFAAVNLRQAEYDEALDTDLDARAQTAAQGYRLDEETAFQKRAFEDFISRCEQAQRTVVLLEGGYNPVFARHMDPALRPDLLKFLAELSARHPNVVLVPTAELPVQTPADYQDLNHVNDDMQRRFTDWLAGWLETRLAQGR